MSLLKKIEGKGLKRLENKVINVCEYIKLGGFTSRHYKIVISKLFNDFSKYYIVKSKQSVRRIKC